MLIKMFACDCVVCILSLLALYRVRRNKYKRENSYRVLAAVYCMFILGGALGLYFLMTVLAEEIALVLVSLLVFRLLLGHFLESCWCTRSEEMPSTLQEVGEVNFICSLMVVMYALATREHTPELITAFIFIHIYGVQLPCAMTYTNERTDNNERIQNINSFLQH